jgi:diguanylate cyclase (GGDEF)-like protein
MPNNFASQKRRPFLSIRWKLFLALACLIVAIHFVGAISFLNFQKNTHTETLYHNKREKLISLDALINSVNSELNKSLMALTQAHFTETLLTADSLPAGVDDLFEKMVSNQNATSIDLMSAKGDLVQHWGRASNLDTQVIQSAITLGIAAKGLNCVKTCRLFVILPVFSKQQLIAIMLVQQPIDPLLRLLSQENELTIGLFEDFPQDAGYKSWNDQLYNLTQRELNIELLIKLSAEQKNLKLNQSYVVLASENQYLVSFESLLISETRSLKRLLIQKITHRSQLLDTSIRSIRLWGSISLIVSLLLIYIIINRFSRQLSKILAMSKAMGLEYNLVGIKDKTGDRRILDDELQQYDRQLANISLRMGAFRQVESHNALKLQSMAGELHQTKNFIDSLLNDEESVVLVQKLNGEIITLSQAGCELFEIDDASGLTYSQIFCADISGEEGLSALNYLYLGTKTLVKAEVKWRNSKDQLYVLFWVHASLSVSDTIDPVIFSICVDITLQRKAEDRLQWLAFNESSLANKNKQFFLEYLPSAIARSLERHKILALLYCEISGFPTSLDMFSDVKTTAIKKISERMSGCLRQYDMITLLNDDHFVIVLEGLSDISDSQLVTDKIISSYDQSIECDGKDCLLDIVIGVSYAAQHTDNVAELIKNAEMAMFQAKTKKVKICSAVIAAD